MYKGNICLTFNRLDTVDKIEQASVWNEIKQMSVDIPFNLHYFYPTFKKWQGRAFLLNKGIHYVRREREDAYQLGIVALNDKSSIVRYCAIELIAYAQRKEAIPFLEKLLTHSDRSTQEHTKRAIHALKKQNHHLFLGEKQVNWIVASSSDEIISILESEILTSKNNKWKLLGKIKSFLNRL